jgi:hypothetical protein
MSNTLEVALEGLVPSLSQQIAVNGTTDKLLLVTSGGDAKYVIPARLAQITSIDPVPIDSTPGTIDVTGADGSVIEITGTGDIDTITMNDEDSRIIEFTSGGGTLTDTGGNLIVAGNVINITAGMKVKIVGRGSDTECIPLSHFSYLGDISGGSPTITVDTSASGIDIVGDTVNAGSPLGQVRVGDGPSGLGNTTNIIINDANINKTITMNADNGISANNFTSGLATQATAAGTTTLTVSSMRTQVFTGATTETVVLPVVTTLPRVGHAYEIYNDSSGVVTVNSSGGNAVQVMASGSRATITCVLLTGTTAASWIVRYQT